MVTDDDHDNNLVAAGALYALLEVMSRGSAWPAERLTGVDLVMNEDGYPTNQMDITLSFMGSPYRITVERVCHED